MNRQTQVAIEKANDAFIKLELLPQVINTFVKEYKLDVEGGTMEEMLYLGRSKEELYSLLTLIQYEIWDTKEKLQSLYDDEGIEKEAERIEQLCLSLKGHSEELATGEPEPASKEET